MDFARILKAGQPEKRRRKGKTGPSRPFTNPAAPRPGAAVYDPNAEGTVAGYPAQPLRQQGPPAGTSMDNVTPGFPAPKPAF